MSDLTIRCAGPGDASALSHLAALDSSLIPAGELLLAELGGELAAALSIASGHVIADPFRRTAELVSILRLRAEQLHAAEGSSRRRWRMPRVAARSA